MGYQNESPRPDGRSRASVYVRRSLQHPTVNLDSLSCSVAVDVSVTIRLHDMYVTVLFMQWVEIQWDRRQPIQGGQRCYYTVCLCGDMNAYCESRGGSRSDRREEGLCDDMMPINLLALNGGRAAFLRARVGGSVPHLTLASLELGLQV